MVYQSSSWKPSRQHLWAQRPPHTRLLQLPARYHGRMALTTIRRLCAQVHAWETLTSAPLHAIGHLTTLQLRVQSKTEDPMASATNPPRERPPMRGPQKRQAEISVWTGASDGPAQAGREPGQGAGAISEGSCP